MKRLRRSRHLLLVLLLLLAGGLRLHQSATLGTQADEGIHVTVAERVALGGDRVYRDLFENRTPGVEWLLAGLFRLTGPSIFAARVLSVAMATLTVAAIVRTTRETVRAFGVPRAHPLLLLSGLLSGTLFALAPLPLFWARYTMLEHFATAAATLSVALTLVALDRRRSLPWVGAGLLAALAIVFKQTELILLPAAGCFFVLLLFSEYRPRLRTALPLWTAGLAVGLGAFLVVLVVQGTVADFVQMLSGAERLAPLANWEEKWRVLARWAWRRPQAVLALPGFLILLRHRSPHLVLGASWTAVALISLLLPPELDLSPGGFSHYMVTPVAALSILAGSVVGRVAFDLDYRYAKVVGTGAIALLLLAAPGWWRDLQSAVGESDYPQPDFTAERTIGRATAMLTADEEAQPILVLGNAVIYHWAQRAPASRYFHFPAYFNSSPAGAAAFAEWTALMNERNMDAVVISRQHLQERLPDDLQAALWANWTPVALFPYPYQRDMLLFRPAVASESGSAVAAFAGEILLLEQAVQPLDERTFLLKLVWQSRVQPANDYTVFVHVRNAQGQLVTQADSVPVVGYRPTSGWQPEELIVDYHWISVPAGTDPAASMLYVGLYRPDTNERLPVRGRQSQATIHDQSLVIPLGP